MGNSPTASFSGQDQSGALTVPLDQLETVKQKAKPFIGAAGSTSSLSVPLEELEPAQPKAPAPSFDSLYGKPVVTAAPQNPFGVSTTPVAVKPTPTMAADRVTEPQVTLAPPENPKPPSDYWVQEYAARQRDIEKINQAEQVRQRRQEEQESRQAQISHQPFETRVVSSMMEPGTTLGTVMRQHAVDESAPQFESDYFRHRAAEATGKGKSVWSDFPRSLAETLLRSQNPRMRADDARRISEPLTQPLVDLPTVTGHASEPFAAGAERAVGGFTSPENLALLGALGGLEGASKLTGGFLRQAPRIVSGLFATQMGAGLVESARDYQKAKAAGDVETAQRILGSALVQAPLTLLTAYHAGAGRTGAPMHPEELLETIHAIDTAAQAPTIGETAPTTKPISVPLDQLQSAQSAGAGKPKFESTPPEVRALPKVEATDYGRQQAQGYVNFVRDVYTREYAQSYLNANLEGTLEPDRGNVSPLDAAAIRRAIDGRLTKEPAVPVAQKYAPDILDEAHAELAAAHGLASSFERPGRYHADLGPEYGAREQDKAWHGVSSSRDIVAQQFPWYSDESVTPAKLADAVERGKGANYERIVDRIADHIQAQREEARPILEEFAPQLEALASQIHDVDPELSRTLLDIRSGRYASLRDLPAFIEGKVADAQRAAEFSHAFDDLAGAEAGDTLPKGAEESVEPHGGPREAGGRQEEARRQLAALEVSLDQLEPQATHSAQSGREERRQNLAERQRVAEMTPEEMKRELLTSEVTGLPNRRAFDESGTSQAVGMSDADGLKALNDRFGYEAGNELLRAKADALREAGLQAYHDKGDEFLYRDQDPEQLQTKLERARNILRERVIEATMADGSVRRFKGADFSYGYGKDLADAEAGLKTNKSEREARGERARGELRGIAEVGPEKGEVHQGAEEKAVEPGRRESQPALPGMASAIREQREAAGREQGRKLTEEITRPPESIEATAGHMERESPLFRGTAASPQSEMFVRKPGGETLYGGLGFLDPELIRKVMPESLKNALAENVSIGEREAGIVREKTGELARKKEQVFQRYADAVARWEKRPIQEGRDFILREQHGEKQPNAEDQAIADQLQKEFASRRATVEGLSHGSFDHWKEHYFPQMWERPTEVADWVVKQIMGGKRPLQGPAGFRKARVFEDIQEGLGAGFKPITNNPVTMALLKLHEMDRYAMAHEILGTMKREDLAKAVMVGEHAPQGWTRISDGISTIYGDRKIPIKEYYDEAVLSKLSETAKNLGIEHERAVRIGGSRLGYTSEGSNRIVTRFATPEAVIAHEIGHQLDWKYGLKEQLIKDPRYKLELRKLVDLKWEGKEEQNVPESFRKYIRKGEEKVATIVEALVQVPDKFREVAPNTWAFLQKLIANNPELKPLLETKPSLVYGQRGDTVSAGGMVIRGYYYAPPEAARVLNNYLAPGLRGNPLYDLFRGAGNTLNQAQLGFSAFHALFSGINSTISDFALALRKASRLSITQAAKASVRAVPLIASPIRHVITGTRLMHEYLSPGKYAEYSELADAVAKSGGRVYQDPLYRNAAIAKFWKAWGEGDWKRVGLQAFPAALEKMASPVMEHLVPRLKLGAFADMAREALDRLPSGAGEAEIRQALDRTWDSVDNRFGQVVYDNLFVNKTLKDLGLVSVRSLGWNLGTVRELGGAAKDTGKAAGRVFIGERPQFTDRMAYAMALPIITGYIGALVNYAYTGDGPREPKDYFFPRTGRTLPSGEPERLSLPTYMKDVYAFAKHPFETAGHKVHPLISMIADMLENKDFYGVEIRHADDPLVKQAGQIAGYIAEQSSPLSLRNLKQRAQAEGRPGVTGMLREAVSPSGAQSFFGITPAPASVTHTAAEEKALEILERRRPQGTRTSEEYEHQARRSYLRGEVAAGRMKPMDLAARVQAGEINPKEAGDILRQVREAPIVHFTRSLSLEDFLSVWDAANAREQEQLRPMLIAKRHLLANLPASERAPMAARLNAAIEARPKAPYLSRQR